MSTLSNIDGQKKFQDAIDDVFVSIEKRDTIELHTMLLSSRDENVEHERKRAKSFVNWSSTLCTVGRETDAGMRVS